MKLQSRLKGLVNSQKDKDITRSQDALHPPVNPNIAAPSLKSPELTLGNISSDEDVSACSMSERKQSADLTRSANSRQQSGDTLNSINTKFALQNPPTECYSEFDVLKHSEGQLMDADDDEDLSSHLDTQGSAKDSKSGKNKLAKWKNKAMKQGGKLMVKAAEKKQGLAGDWSEFKEKHRKKEGFAEYSKVFGLPLDASLAKSQIDASCPLPAVVIRCIEFLEGRGMYEVGLYRIPGSTTAVGKLKAAFDAGQDIDLFLMDPPVDPHAVATLIKLFLRELPENVLGDLHGSFSAIVAAEGNPLPLLAALARQLPLPNYYLLSWLSSHLSRLVYFSSINKMTLNNLALIFCPTLHIDTLLFTLFVDHPIELFPLDDDGNIPDEVFKGDAQTTLARLDLLTADMIQDRYSSPLIGRTKSSPDMLNDENSAEEASSENGPVDFASYIEKSDLTNLSKPVRSRNVTGPRMLAMNSSDTKKSSSSASLMDQAKPSNNRIMTSQPNMLCVNSIGSPPNSPPTPQNLLSSPDSF